MAPSNKILCFFCFMCITLVGAKAVHAHQQKYSTVEILINEATGNIEISHRLQLHDAQHFSQKWFGSSEDLALSKTMQKHLSEYVGERTQLYINDQISELTHLGHELDGKYFWVYLEMVIPTQISSLAIQYDGFINLWQSQVNWVNLSGLGPTQSASLNVNHTKHEFLISTRK